MERDQILNRLRERIVRFAASRIGTASAEDLAQEVLMVLHEKYADVDSVEELVPLSLKIARFKIMASRRKSVRRGEYTQVPVDELPLPSDVADPEMQAESAETLRRLEDALSGLGDRCRELFRMKLEGLTFPQIRERFDVVSINTIYTWDFRCRQQLKAKMAAAETGENSNEIEEISIDKRDSQRVTEA